MRPEAILAEEEHIALPLRHPLVHVPSLPGDADIGKSEKYGFRRNMKEYGTLDTMMIGIINGFREDGSESLNNPGTGMKNRYG
jgi:hypothetical protein